MTNSHLPFTPLKVDELGWSRFLQLWSDHVLDLVKQLDYNLSPITQEAIALGYLGYPGASAQEIATAEERLDRTLPDSYKQFLRVSNGWRQMAMYAEDCRMFAVDEIDLFRYTHPDAVDGWLRAIPTGYDSFRTPDDKYFIYGAEQDASTLRDEYVATAYAISELIDAAIYLLNPMVITPDGEWEAWYFGYALAGAYRYRSFQEMMEAEYLRIVTDLREMIRYTAELGKQTLNKTGVEPDTLGFVP